MLPDRNILKTAKTILKIQDRLHPLLFGEDGYMLEETRQELLKKANFYIVKVLRTIQDIQVSDIILVGSSASYFYSAASDFDLKIILNLSRNRAIGSNIKKFLKILNNTFYRNNVRLRLYNHFIDIKFDEDDNFVMGNYSVLHNRWNIKPRCDFDLTGVQPALLIQNFYKKTASSYRSFAEFSPQNGCFRPAELQKIAQNFTDYFQADAHVRADVDSGLIDFLSFKLIRKTHFLRELIDFERQANNDRLSLREEYER